MEMVPKPTIAAFIITNSPYGPKPTAAMPPWAGIQFLDGYFRN